MTAMFVVILLEQIKGGVKNLPSVTVGVAASVASLLIFGGSSFLLPAMGLMLISLAVLKKPISYIEKREGGAND
jgi:predicted branched-subunit amino acid permease